MEMVGPKNKLPFFFQFESFGLIFNFHSFNGINCFVTTQHVTTIFYLFYLNYCLHQTRIEWIRQDLVAKQQFLTRKLLGREL